MKRKNYSIGRSFTALVAGIMLTALAVIFTGSVYEGTKSNSNVEIVKDSMSDAADYVISAVSNTINQVDGALFTGIVVALIAIPTLASIRMNGSFGFQRQKVFVPEINLWLSYTEKALYDFVTLGGAKDQTVQDFLSGKLRFEQFAVSIKATITNNSGNKEIFNSSSAVYRQGRIPELFNQAQLPEGTNLAISHIGLAYATDATATVPEGDVDYSRVVTAWPAGMANGELVIWQNTNVKARFDAKFAGSQANGTQSGVESDGLEFSPAIILEEKKNTKLEFRFAEGQTISNTNNHFIDVCMLGSILKLK